MTFEIGWVFAEVQILKKKWDYCKMTFIIGRGFVRECIQLGKFSDNYLNVHRCTIWISWHSKKNISGAHFCSALFWCRIYASFNLSIQRNLKALSTPRTGAAYIYVAVFLEYLRMRNFSVFYICSHCFLEEFDYTARVQHVLHTTWYNWVEVVLDNISLSRWNEKSENDIISWTEWNILVDFSVTIDINKRLWNVIFHRSRFSRAPNSEKVKMALSLELSGILWWNFSYTLALTRCSPRDCQMTFGIDRGLIEVLPRFKFWKKWNLTLKPVWNILITFDIGQGFAERWILKKWKWHYLLNEWNILLDLCVNIDINKI